MIKIKQATKKGYIEMCDGGVFDASYPGSRTRRGRVQDGGNVCPTITAQNQEVYRIDRYIIDDTYDKRPVRLYTDNAPTLRCEGGRFKIMERYRIRKLTPKECGRLMGLKDDEIDKILSVNSNSQCYKQFGNSIVVDVMVYMFKNLLKISKY